MNSVQTVNEQTIHRSLTLYTTIKVLYTYFSATDMEFFFRALIVSYKVAELTNSEEAHRVFKQSCLWLFVQIQMRDQHATARAHLRAYVVENGVQMVNGQSLVRMVDLAFLALNERGTLDTVTTRIFYDLHEALRGASVFGLNALYTVRADAYYQHTHVMNDYVRYSTIWNRLRQMPNRDQAWLLYPGSCFQWMYVLEPINPPRNLHLPIFDDRVEFSDPHMTQRVDMEIELPMAQSDLYEYQNTNNVGAFIVVDDSIPTPDELQRATYSHDDEPPTQEPIEAEDYVPDAVQVPMIGFHDMSHRDWIKSILYWIFNIFSVFALIHFLSIQFTNLIGLDYFFWEIIFQSILMYFGHQVLIDTIVCQAFILLWVKTKYLVPPLIHNKYGVYWFKYNPDASQEDIDSFDRSYVGIRLTVKAWIYKDHAYAAFAPCYEEILKCLFTYLTGWNAGLVLMQYEYFEKLYRMMKHPSTTPSQFCKLSILALISGFLVHYLTFTYTPFWFRFVFHSLWNAAMPMYFSPEYTGVAWKIFVESILQRFVLNRATLNISIESAMSAREYTPNMQNDRFRVRYCDEFARYIKKMDFGCFADLVRELLDYLYRWAWMNHVKTLNDFAAHWEAKDDAEHLYKIWNMLENFDKKWPKWFFEQAINQLSFDYFRTEKRNRQIARKHRIINRGEFKAIAKQKFGWAPANIRKGSWESKMIEEYFQNAFNIHDKLLEHFNNNPSEMISHSMAMHRPRMKGSKKQMVADSANVVAEVPSTVSEKVQINIGHKKQKPQVKNFNKQMTGWHEIVDEDKATYSCRSCVVDSTGTSEVHKFLSGDLKLKDALRIMALVYLEYDTILRSLRSTNFSIITFVKELIRICLSHSIFDMDIMTPHLLKIKDLVELQLQNMARWFLNGFDWYSGPMDLLKQLGKSELMTVIQSLSYSTIVLSSVAYAKSFDNDIMNTIFSACSKSFIAIKELPSLTNFIDIIMDQVIPAIYHGDLSYIRADADTKKRMAVVALMCSITTANFQGMRQHIRQYEDKEKFMVSVGEINNQMLIYENYGPNQLYHKCYALLTSYYDIIIELRDKASITLCDALETAINLCLTKCTSVRRRQPIGFGFRGPAGTGKSTTYCEIAIAAASRAFNLEFEKTIIEEREEWRPVTAENVPIGNKFMDNISSGTEVIKIDDAGICNPDMTSPDVNPHQVFMLITGGDWAVIPRSSMEAKQGQFFNNKITLITSNSPDYMFNTYITNEEAWKRRLTLDTIVMQLTENGSQYTQDDLDHLLKSGIQINPQEPAYKFIVSEHVQNSTRRRMHYLRTDVEFANLVKTVSEAYVRTQEAHTRTVTTLSSICPRCSNIYLVHTRAEDNITLQCPIPAGLIVPIDNVIDLIPFTICEELAMHMFALMLTCFVHPTIAACLLIIFRLMIETVSYYLRTAYQLMDLKIFLYKVALFSLLMLSHPVLAVFIHVCYNMFVYKSLIFNFLTRGGQLTPSVLLGDRLTPVLEGLKDSMTEFKSTMKQILICGMTLTAFSYAVKYCYTLYSSYADYTYLEADEGEVKKNQELSQLYDHTHFEGPEIGRVASWAKFKHKTDVVLPSNGTMATAAALNVVMVNVLSLNAQDVIVRSSRVMGYVQNNILYTVAHVFELAMIMDKTISSFQVEISYANRKQSGTGEIKRMTKMFPASEFKRIGTQDLVAMTFDTTYHNKLPKFSEFKFKQHDEFVTYSSEMQEMHYKLDGDYNLRLSCSWINKDGSRGTKVEVVDSVLKGDVSKPGESGRPIFLVKRDGKHVMATFVGIQSSITEHGNIGVITIPPNPKGPWIYSSLEIPSDDTDLMRYIEDRKRKITFDHSVKDEISHFSTIENVGRFIGTLDSQPINNVTSKYRRTSMYPQAVMFCPDLEKMGPPIKTRGVQDGEFYSSILGYLAKSQRAVSIVDQSNLLECTKQVFEQCRKSIDLRLNVPLSNEQVIAGAFNVNPMDGKKSAGFSFPGKKKYDILREHDGKPMLNAELAEKIKQAYDWMDKGYGIQNVCVAAEKDELKDKKKFTDGLTRIFFAGDVVFMWFCKKYLGPIFALMMASRENLSCQVGVNAIGPEFHKMLHDISDGDFDDPGATDGDWSGWDTSVMGVVYSLIMFLWLYEESPYYINNPKELFYVKCILEAMQCWSALLNKQLIAKEDQMPSGEYGTSQINSSANEILACYRFYFCYAKHHHIPINGMMVRRVTNEIRYHDKATPKTFGDDIFEFMKKDARYFMNTERVREFARMIGMDWTPAHKTETEFKFKPIREILFLKRTPRYEPILKRYVGKLEQKSIAKMLGYCDSNDPNWSKAVEYTAIREMSFHGEEEYQKLHEYFGFNLPPREHILMEIDRNDGYMYEEPSTTITKEESIFYCNETIDMSSTGGANVSINNTKGTFESSN